MNGWKLRFPIDHVPARQPVEWTDFVNTLRRQLPDEGRTWLDAHPRPALINRYWRTYFVSPHGDFRITVDSRQRVWDQRYKPHLVQGGSTNLPDTVVLEVKFHPDLAEQASQLLATVPARLSRHSKYISGMRSILSV